MTAALDAIRAMSEEAASYKDTVYVKRAHKAVRYLLAALDRTEAVVAAAQDVDGMWDAKEGELIRWLPESAECLDDLREALRAYEDADKVGVQP